MTGQTVAMIWSDAMKHGNKHLWTIYEVLSLEPLQLIGPHTRGNGNSIIVLCLCHVSLHYMHLIPAPVDQRSASACSYKHPWITCPKMRQAHQWPTSSLWTEATFSCEIIYTCTSMPRKRWRSCVRSCINMSGYLVQELNVGTAAFHANLSWTNQAAIVRQFRSNGCCLKGTQLQCSRSH